jgi:hypothetical protein
MLLVVNMLVGSILLAVKLALFSRGYYTVCSCCMLCGVYFCLLAFQLARFGIGELAMTQTCIYAVLLVALAVHFAVHSPTAVTLCNGRFCCGH